MNETVTVKTDKATRINALNNADSVDLDKEADAVWDAVNALNETDRQFIIGMVKGAAAAMSAGMIG